MANTMLSSHELISRKTEEKGVTREKKSIADRDSFDGKKTTMSV